MATPHPKVTQLHTEMVRQASVQPLIDPNLSREDRAKQLHELLKLALEAERAHLYFTRV